MVEVSWIIEELENWAPAEWAEDWDNVGLLVGDAKSPVSKILVALDVSEEVVAEAIAGRYDLLISHHPLIYSPLKRITADTLQGRKILSLIKSEVGLYCAHTNLDKAPGGVNDCLFAALGLKNPEEMLPDGSSVGLGRVGQLSNEMTLAELAAHAKNALNLPDIRFAGDGNAVIKKVGVCGGSGSDSRFLHAARQKGCDVYLTGDLRYHGVQEALEMGLKVIDITHYASEIPVVDAVVLRLRDAAEKAGKKLIIAASQANGQVFQSK